MRLGLTDIVSVGTRVAVLTTVLVGRSERVADSVLVGVLVLVTSVRVTVGVKVIVGVSVTVMIGGGGGGGGVGGSTLSGIFAWHNIAPKPEVLSGGHGSQVDAPSLGACVPTGQGAQLSAFSTLE